jgi:hypothetical protein
MGDRSDQVKIRNYRADDLAACRALWVELTEWHRQIYASPQIGGTDPGPNSMSTSSKSVASGSGWRQSESKSSAWSG